MTSTRYRFNPKLYNELSSFIYILLKSMDIFKLRLKNQNQSVNDHKKAVAEKKRVSPSLVPRPVGTIRAIRGGLEPRANFRDHLER